jgi:hypothetical protein
MWYGVIESVPDDTVSHPRRVSFRVSVKRTWNLTVIRFFYYSVWQHRVIRALTRKVGKLNNHALYVCVEPVTDTQKIQEENGL